MVNEDDVKVVNFDLEVLKKGIEDISFKIVL